MKIITPLAILFIILSCNSNKTITVQFLDKYEVPSNQWVQNTKLGGLSGIDFDSIGKRYYLISDDRSRHNSARFYNTKIAINNNRIDTIIFSKAVTILNDLKTPFKNEEVDFESIRFNPELNLLVLGDEGGKKGNTAIRMVDLNGSLLQNINMNKTYIDNIRNNKSFESISFSRDYKSMFYATEAPLIRDGAIASEKNKGLLRIIERDVKKGNVKREFLYWLEKTPQKASANPPWKGAGSDNGLSELIALKDNNFLALERSGAYQKDGSFNYICKVFFVTSKKNNLSEEVSTYKTNKKEIFDFYPLTNGQFNIEGMTLGPIIDNNQTILFISDNNFKDSIPTMFYLFTISKN